jgi:DNA-3-methyladenine glycosylase II
MHRRALAHLRRVDPVMQRVIDRVGTCTLRPSRDGSHFEHVARAIVYQQLSGKAAATIYGRVVSLFDGSRVEPAALLAAPEERLRAAGLSRQKTTYLRDLAHHAVQGTLAIHGLHKLSDGDIAEQLVQVKGVGVWTAQMFLIFRLGRPDVLPESDLGIRKGVQLAYRLRALPTPKKVAQLGAKWAPYRTVASWYLWRLLDARPAPRRKARRA